MLPDRVSNPGPLTYESGALPIALRGPAFYKVYKSQVLILISMKLQTSIHNDTGKKKIVTRSNANAQPMSYRAT